MPKNGGLKDSAKLFMCIKHKLLKLFVSLYDTYPFIIYDENGSHLKRL